MEEQQFTFFWRDGKRTMCVGFNPADALTKVGYGAGAVRALDFYSEGDNKEYYWDHKSREWKREEQLHV